MYIFIIFFRITSLGEQGSLTDAEFKEYNELSAQMATYLPSQIKGYNSLGTAILSVGDSTKQVNNALQSEKLTQYAKSANEASDVIDKYIAEIESILGGNLNDLSSEEAEKGIRDWTSNLVKDLQKKDTQDALTSLFALDDKRNWYTIWHSRCKR